MIVELAIGVPTYFLVAGMSRRVLWWANISECPKCALDPETGRWMHRIEEDRGSYTKITQNDSIYQHGGDAAIASLFWPISLPWTLGKRMDSHVRMDRRHRAQLLEAIHERNLRQIRAEEERILDQQLKELEQPGEDHSGS